MRILLAYLAREARTLGRAIHPRIAYALDHHVRAYVDVREAAAETDPVSVIDPATCDGARVGGSGPFGPLWLGPIFDPALVARLEVPPTAERPKELGRFLERIREEADVAVPFYYEPNVLAGHLGLRSPPSIVEFRGALEARGYRTARTHARPEGVRTDAPRSVVEQAARDLSPA